MSDYEVWLQTYRPINPRPRYPNWQTRLIRPAIQSYRDSCYEEIAQLLAPDDTFSAAQVEGFLRAVRFKVEQMTTRVGAIRRILEESSYYPYRYRDENAVEAFQNWIRQLKPFTSPALTEKLDHHSHCEDRRCLRYRCLFHYTNSEASLAVYRSDFDVIRNPRTGQLVEVAILVPRAY